jgi:hypothetical protein
MRDTEIEITQPITVEASITFTIDREQWGKADDAFRKSLIAGEIAIAQRKFDRSGGVAGIYLVVTDWSFEAHSEHDPASVQ